MKNGLNGGAVFAATGFTGNPEGLPSSQPTGSAEVLGYGDSKSYQGFFVYNVVREAEVMEVYSDIDYQALFSWVGATDHDNPYNINGSKNKDPKTISAITQSTSATDNNLDDSNISSDKLNVMQSINIYKEFP